MKKNFDIQLFDESRAALLRSAIADYVKIGDTYELMGTGFTKLDENPGAQTDSETYINETTASTDITGYETEFSYESRLIPSQKAIYTLWKQGRDHATGGDAQLEYVRVELFNPVGEASEAAAEFTARHFIVANEVSETTGEGGGKISVSGTLHAVGDPELGKFDTVTRKFVAGDFKGKFDVAAAG